MACMRRVRIEGGGGAAGRQRKAAPQAGRPPAALVLLIAAPRCLVAIQLCLKGDAASELSMKGPSEHGCADHCCQASRRDQHCCNNASDANLDCLAVWMERPAGKLGLLD